MVKLVKLVDLVEKISSWNPLKELNSAPFKYIDLSAVDKDRKIIDPELVPVVEPKDAPSRARQLIDVNDVLVSTVRPNLNGVALIEDAQYSGATASTGYCVLRPKKEKLDFKYLYYWVRTKRFIDEMIRLSTGASYPAVSDKIIKNSKIPLPPLEEQKRIAAILDKADVVRRKRQQAIDLTDQLLRSVFLDMFGDPVTNPKGIVLAPMTDIFHITTGKLNSNAAIEGGKYPFFTCAKEIFAIDTSAFDQEALLLAGNNAQAIYDVKHYIGKFNAYQRTYVLTLKDANSSYPFYQFSLEYQLENLKRFSKGSNTKYITMEIMERTMLPLARPEEQLEFVRRVESVRSLTASYLRHNELSEKNFQSLTQQAFRGELTKQTEAA